MEGQNSTYTSVLIHALVIFTMWVWFPSLQDCLKLTPWWVCKWNHWTQWHEFKQLTPVGCTILPYSLIVSPSIAFQKGSVWGVSFNRSLFIHCTVTTHSWHEELFVQGMIVLDKRLGTGSQCKQGPWPQLEKVMFWGIIPTHPTNPVWVVVWL